MVNIGRVDNITLIECNKEIIEKINDIDGEDDPISLMKETPL